MHFGWKIQEHGHVGAEHDQREGLRGLPGPDVQRPGQEWRQGGGQHEEVHGETELARVLQHKIPQELVRVLQSCYWNQCHALYFVCLCHKSHILFYQCLQKKH